MRNPFFHKDRILVRGWARILNEKDVASGRGLELAFEMRIWVKQHRARLIANAINDEFSGQDVPDLRKAVVVLGMIDAVPELTVEQRERIFGRNALELMGEAEADH